MLNKTHHRKLTHHSKLRRLAVDQNLMFRVYCGIFLTHWSSLESQILVKHITLFVWEQVMLRQAAYQTYCSLCCATIGDWGISRPLVNYLETEASGKHFFIIDILKNHNIFHKTCRTNFKVKSTLPQKQLFGGRVVFFQCEGVDSDLKLFEGNRDTEIQIQCLISLLCLLWESWRCIFLW